MGGSDEREIPTKEEYFYTKFDSYSTDSNLKETVKLEPCIKNVYSNVSCQIQLIIFTNSSRTAYKLGGTTEKGYYDSTVNKIKFHKFFIMEYVFEKDQPIEFRITGSIKGRISTSLPLIMGSRGQTFKKIIDGTNGYILEIKGFSYKSKIISTLNFNVTINGNLNETSLMYLIKSKGNINNKAKDISLYKSEVISPLMGVTKVNFKNCSIPDIYIASDGNYENNNLSVEIYKIYDAKYMDKLGEYYGNLKQVIKNNKNINLGEFGNANLFIDAIKNYSFLDYLRGGMQINLHVAIDFTGSNGQPNLPNSLHQMGPNENAYEKAIRSCGKIVAYYDYDQKFPVYGFGAKFYGNEKVDHCFPLNLNPNDPEVYGIDGILNAYKKTLNNCELWGPTYFHHFIDRINNDVKKEIEKENFSVYNIIMILTDGIIEDMNETINALVEASYLPISVIIIGIGNADFSDMDKLDADENPLYDANGRKADRDLVQFVPFKQFKNDAQKLAEQVLDEVPRQIVEFYQHRKMPPGEPITDINKYN